jgi:hypothetical protein
LHLRLVLTPHLNFLHCLEFVLTSSFNSATMLAKVSSAMPSTVALGNSISSWLKFTITCTRGPVWMLVTWSPASRLLRSAI